MTCPWRFPRCWLLTTYRKGCRLKKTPLVLLLVSEIKNRSPLPAIPATLRVNYMIAWLIEIPSFHPFQIKTYTHRPLTFSSFQCRGRKVSIRLTPKSILKRKILKQELKKKVIKRSKKKKKKQIEFSIRSQISQIFAPSFKVIVAHRWMTIAT